MSMFLSTSWAEYFDLDSLWCNVMEKCCREASNKHGFEHEVARKYSDYDWAISVCNQSSWAVKQWNSFRLLIPGRRRMKGSWFAFLNRMIQLDWRTTGEMERSIMEKSEMVGINKEWSMCKSFTSTRLRSSESRQIIAFGPSLSFVAWQSANLALALTREPPLSRSYVSVQGKAFDHRQKLCKHHQDVINFNST